uniref:Uncharacterized protein n=1 Tax=Rhizophora mucronata TaxID=61149 RepID=A0A2P2J039_RHIMU
MMLKWQLDLKRRCSLGFFFHLFLFCYIFVSNFEPLNYCSQTNFI